MKTNERWIRKDHGSVWKINKLLKHTFSRQSREEGVDIECILVKPFKNNSYLTKEQKLLTEIFGDRFKVGDIDTYTRTDFLELFEKIY